MIPATGKILYITALIAGILLLQSCVHDDFGEPEASEIPVGEVISIAELRSMHQVPRSTSTGMFLCMQP